MSINLFFSLIFLLSLMNIRYIADPCCYGFEGSRGLNEDDPWLGTAISAFECQLVCEYKGYHSI
jgi:hypothetical protein